MLLTWRCVVVWVSVSVCVCILSMFMSIRPLRAKSGNMWRVPLSLPSVVCPSVVAPSATGSRQFLMCVFVYAVCHYLHTHIHTLKTHTYISLHVIAAFCSCCSCRFRCKTHFGKMQTYVICMQSQHTHTDTQSSIIDL